MRRHAERSFRLITQNFCDNFPLYENNQPNTMTEIIHRIVSKCPAVFFQRVVEYIDAGFGEAITLAGRHIEEPEKGNMVGQLRHARCEAGFRKAGEESGLAVHAPHTAPAGSRYSLVVANGVYLIRGNIQRHCGPPRPTAFRKEWAALNRWLEPQQRDMWEKLAVPPADRLCGMIVTTVDPRFGNPAVPAFVGLGIPWPDLSGWAKLIPVNELLTHYHDKESEERTPQATPVEVKDRAVPKLKNKKGGSE